LGRLTTHVLDTANGVPAAGVVIQLNFFAGEKVRQMASAITNDDGRCEAPIVQGSDFIAGLYELQFHVGDYFRALSGNLPGALFLDVVPVRFGIADASVHYHVPLLVSPFGYTSYRGS